VCVVVEGGLASLALVRIAEIDLVVGVIPPAHVAEKSHEPHGDRLHDQYAPVESTRTDLPLSGPGAPDHAAIRAVVSRCHAIAWSAIDSLGLDPQTCRDAAEIARSHVGNLVRAPDANRSKFAPRMRAQQSNTDQQMSFRNLWSSSTSSRIASGS
jgi:hypothetical protein